ncbi:unnamed protein product, partial [Choristocarpus tenellus]
MPLTPMVRPVTVANEGLREVLGASSEHLTRQPTPMTLTPMMRPVTVACEGEKEGLGASSEHLRRLPTPMPLSSMVRPVMVASEGVREGLGASSEHLTRQATPMMGTGVVTGEGYVRWMPPFPFPPNLVQKGSDTTKDRLHIDDGKYDPKPGTDQYNNFKDDYDGDDPEPLKQALLYRVQANSWMIK